MPEPAYNDSINDADRPPCISPRTDSEPLTCVEFRTETLLPTDKSERIETESSKHDNDATLVELPKRAIDLLEMELSTIQELPTETARERNVIPRIETGEFSTWNGPLTDVCFETSSLPPTVKS
jgi:hypothetical protein